MLEAAETPLPPPLRRRLLRRLDALPDALGRLLHWLPGAVAVALVPGLTIFQLVVPDEAFLVANQLPTRERIVGVVAAVVGANVVAAGYLVWWRRRRREGVAPEEALRDLTLRLSPLLFAPVVTWMVATGREGQHPFLTLALAAAIGAWSGRLAYCFAPAWSGRGATAAVAALGVAVVAAAARAGELRVALLAGAIAAGAAPVYLLARRLTGRPWIAAALAASYLLHPAVHRVLLAPDPAALALPLLAAAVWLAEGRSRVLLPAVVVALLALRPELAAAVAALGIWLVADGRPRAGLVVVLAGAALLVLGPAPALSGAGAFTEAHGLQLALVLAPLLLAPLLAGSAVLPLAAAALVALLAGADDRLAGPLAVLAIGASAFTLGRLPRLAPRVGLDPGRAAVAVAAGIVVASLVLAPELGLLSR